MLGLGLVKGTFGVISGKATIADPVTACTARAVIDAVSFSEHVTPAVARATLDLSSI